jgi:hypothetical protein
MKVDGSEYTEENIREMRGIIEKASVTCEIQYSANGSITCEGIPEITISDKLMKCFYPDAGE